jgi:hypothetical protein
VFSISLDLQLPTLSRSFSVFLSLGLTISFSLCSAEKEDRSRGIIRKEGEEEKKRRKEKERRRKKKRSENGRCFWNMRRRGERGEDEARSDRRERERKQ